MGAFLLRGAVRLFFSERWANFEAFLLREVSGLKGAVTLLLSEALLSGCSAGGLATFLHCDDLGKLLPRGAIVKCLSDAGFFLDA
ncbi:hypothetical protein AMTR_s00009p00240510 [Amborella trichopoda]|uniref:Pectin acetylesterase n=1 Tax=Amborella trichopoda TaxID=13333 RepID=W1NIM5_AMBTC|nr:hypothetical protein AMTR_s00009p00240510 [Amborella trichopoda]